MRVPPPPLDEVADQKGNVLLTRAQGGDVDREHIQAIVEIH